MRARGSLLLVCALALLVPATAAVAKPGYHVSKPTRFVIVSLEGSDGYAVDVLGFNSRQVALTASHFSILAAAPFAYTSAAYSVRGRVSDERLAARFGNRGWISVRFEPKGSPEVEKLSPRCEGKPSVTWRGRFVGTIRFRGEQGFTRVRAESAKGFVSRSYRQVCKRASGNDDPPQRKEPPTTSLGAVSSSPPLTRWFSVLREEPVRRQGLFLGDEAHYGAGTVERLGAMTVYRSAGAIAPSSSLVVSPRDTSPVTATASPPAPFSGTATYTEGAAGEVSWSGDLAVELPGRGEVPLADDSYRAKFCRSRVCACPIGNCAFVSVGAGSSQAQRLRLAARLRP